MELYEKWFGSLDEYNLFVREQLKKHSIIIDPVSVYVVPGKGMHIFYKQSQIF